MLFVDKQGHLRGTTYIVGTLPGAAMMAHSAKLILNEPAFVAVPAPPPVDRPPAEAVRGDRTIDDHIRRTRDDAKKVADLERLVADAAEKARREERLRCLAIARGVTVPLAGFVSKADRAEAEDALNRMAKRFIQAITDGEDRTHQ